MYLYEVRFARVNFAFEPIIVFFLFLSSKYYVSALGRFVLCWCVNPKYSADIDAVFCDFFVFCGFVYYEANTICMSLGWFVWCLRMNPKYIADVDVVVFLLGYQYFAPWYLPTLRMYLRPFSTIPSFVRWYLRRYVYTSTKLGSFVWFLCLNLEFCFYGVNICFVIGLIWVMLVHEPEVHCWCWCGCFMRFLFLFFVFWSKYMVGHWVDSCDVGVWTRSRPLMWMM
jgi:hypothetical protein